MIIEICANSFASAKAAQDGGADRIELCSQLSVGGLTPSLGLIEKVIIELVIPVHILIRPRSGNFTYSEEEFDVMLRDIAFCSEIGCAGIVSGVLDHHLEVDKKRTAKLIEVCKGMDFTFNRAFDWVQDPKEEIQKLIDLKADRVLTSGLQKSAVEGMSLLKELQEIAQGKIEIMPGGGINVDNVMEFKNAGFKSVHLSALSQKQTLYQAPKIPMHNTALFEEGLIAFSDKEKIDKVVKLVSE
ncbi:copper homeostasis protein CutC [Aequorivita sp. H23M31]|uniref:PF03932 family protein CutC n=1 Tax=Aequorivita ciconiae TaxID=2494375 RepID=A0A410G577_9FLAO|nr:copper homeostasis protein CutC [Aequorivita sp. H23M31]QAA82413.1 copper homeostasis protein CutC [Aequorivita sp. H23M31]